MQTAANNNLVLTDVSSLGRFADSQTAISHRGFYQLIPSSLVKGVCKEQLFRKLGDRLVVLAEHAQAFRHMEMLERISQMLVNLPLPRRYEAVGQYYQALCIHRFGRGDVEQAARLLGRVAQDAPPQYRARAMLSMGTVNVRTGHNQTALSLYCDAARFVGLSGLYDPYATVHTQKMVAVMTGEDGNHRDAVTLLENLFPLAYRLRSWEPHVYCDYMNSLAVELCEVGRLEEAKNVSQIVLASPFAPAYPEWRETHDEIDLRGCRASRSVVAFGKISEVNNLVCLPAPQHDVSAGAEKSIPGHTTERARVLDFLELKEKMVKQSNDSPGAKKNYQEMDGRERLLTIIEIAGSKDRTDDDLLRILEAMETALLETKDHDK